MKTIFAIDWILSGVFLLSVVSGFLFHAAGHDGSHEQWHDMAVFHVLTSLLFLIVAILHLITHRGWYKSVAHKGLDRKSKVAAVLTVIFLVTVVTGFVLLGVDGANTETGLWHYRSGIVLVLISVGHIFKRIPLLRKSFVR